MQKRILRVKEVADYLCISVSQVWALSKDGALKPKKMSDRVTVWDVAELNSYIDLKMGGEDVRLNS